MNIINKLKELNEDDYFDPYFDPYFLSEIEGWPLISLPKDEDEDNLYDEDEELLDLENYEVIEIKDRSMIINCGGDWQEPHRVEIILNSNDDLEVVSCSPVDEWKAGLDMNELLGYEN